MVDPLATDDGGGAGGRGQEMLAGWVAGAEALSLLRRAMECGVVEAARTWRTVASIARCVGLEPGQTELICGALHSHGVLSNGDAGYRVSPEFESLAGSERHQRLDHLLDAELVRLRAIAASGATTSYLSLSERDRLVMARNAGSISQALLEGVNRAFSAVEELVEVWASGGRHLELGCGVGCQLLSPLVAYPEMLGVGVEMSPLVAAEASDRAAALGVADRVEIRVGDARLLDDVEAFDTAYWSQPFFACETRAATLAAALRALKSDGTLVAPVLFERPAVLAGPVSVGEHRWRMHALVFGHWDIPILTTAELCDELTDAGFVGVREVPVDATSDGSVLGVSRFVVATKPGAGGPSAG